MKYVNVYQFLFLYTFLHMKYMETIWKLLTIIHIGEIVVNGYISRSITVRHLVLPLLALRQNMLKLAFNPTTHNRTIIDADPLGTRTGSAIVLVDKIVSDRHIFRTISKAIPLNVASPERMGILL